MTIKRVLTTAAPLAIAGAIGLGSGAGTASAAALPIQLPVQLPGLQLPQLPLVNTLNSVTGLLGINLGSAPAAAAPAPAPAHPVSSATANGLNLGIIDTCVSCTHAAAGPSSASTGARALRVLGNDLSAGFTSGTDSQSGSLIALPANGLLGLAIADWMNSSHAGSNASDAHSRSALTDLNLGNGQIATVAVLESASNAVFGGSASQADAANNGVDISLLNGAVALILLHSDVNGNGTESTYVASLNGNQILGSQGSSAGLPITIPGVATIDLLGANAGAGQSNSAIGTVDNLLGGAGQAAGVLTSAASSASTGTTGNGGNGGGSSNSSSTPVAHQPATGIAPMPSAADSSHAPTPMTGISLGLGGFALLAGGVSVILASLRRRRGIDVAGILRLTPVP